MNRLLPAMLLFVLYQPCRAQMPFSTIAQIYNFSIGDTLEYECWAHQGPNDCVPRSDMMTVVIAKNNAPDSLQYTFRQVAYTYSDPCLTPPFGVVDTFVQTYINPDSSIFWYHNPARYSHNADSLYTDTVTIDPQMNNRKRNEHQEASPGAWADTVYADGLGNIYSDYGQEGDGQITYYCSLQYYHKTTGETWGGPLYINPTLDVEDINSSAGIKVFPNPARSILNITSSGPPVTGIELWSVTGSRLRILSRPQDMPIDIFDVSPGVYYARISTTQGVSIRKWVKL
jgi:type IX secretion system substrate protein